MCTPTRKTPYAAIIFTTLIAYGLIGYVSFASTDAIAALGTTSLLLLGVFTIVNIVVLVLRRDPKAEDHFVTPSALPVIGALACFFLVLPLSGRPLEHYRIGGGLLALGVFLWVLTWLANRGLQAKKTYFRNTDDIGGTAPSRAPSPRSGRGDAGPHVGAGITSIAKGAVVRRRSWRGPGA